MVGTERVKVLGISGSGRHASTEWAVKLALKTAETLGYVDTEFVSLANYNLISCNGCMKCFGWQHPADAPSPNCYEHKDDTDVLLSKMLEADGILLGTPIYVVGVTSLTRILMEKAHQFGPMSFTRWAGKMRLKPIGAICVGGGDFGGQEVGALDIYAWAIGLGMLPVSAFPTREDPNPQASEHGGMVSTVDSRAIYAKDALSKAASRTVPPVQGSRNERSLRNIGRHVGAAAMTMKLGVQAFAEGEYPSFETIPFTRYSVKPKKDSWLRKLMDEGVVTYAPKTEIVGDLNPWEQE